MEKERQMGMRARKRNQGREKGRKKKDRKTKEETRSERERGKQDEVNKKDKNFQARKKFPATFTQNRLNPLVLPT